MIDVQKIDVICKKKVYNQHKKQIQGSSKLRATDFTHWLKLGNEEIPKIQ